MLMCAAVGALTLVSLGACATSTKAPAPAAAVEKGASGHFDDHDASADAGKSGECIGVDLLFVIDSSGSMDQAQKSLASGFSKLTGVLDKLTTGGGAKFDYRIAVTTTQRDVSYVGLGPNGSYIPWSAKGENGAFSMGCGMNRRWLERDEDDIAKKFACATDVGVEGGSVEMPLFATKLALRDRVEDGTNAGFLRPDALLAVIIVTDEDDCSREADGFKVDMNDRCEPDPSERPVQDYVDFLDEVKGARGRWMATVVAGPGPGVCSNASSGVTADKAPRLQSFVIAAGPSGRFDSICEADLPETITKTLEQFGAACKAFPVR